MVFLFGPILTPKNSSGVLFLKRSEIISIPSLLNPNLFIIALSFSSLNTLGLGLPSCFFGVIVPTSTNPNPSLNKELYTSALLSKPAASPTGFFNFFFNSSVESISSFST